MVEGVSSQDFSQIFSDLKRTVTYKTAAKTTSNITGTEKLTYTDSTKNIVFLKRSQRFIFDREGIVELGDAYLMAPTTETIAKGDRVVVDGETYEITPMDLSVIRKFGSTSMFIFATLRKTIGVQAV